MMRAGTGLFFFQAEDGIRDLTVTGVQTCALPICLVRLAGDGAERHRSGGEALHDLRGGLDLLERDALLGELEAHQTTQRRPSRRRSEERRVGKECRSRGSPYH